MLRHIWRGSTLVSTSVRCLSSASAASSTTAKVDKEALMKLRKRTGYSYVNCRKALVQFGPEKLDEAVKWLKEVAAKEGWAKAAKLSSRSTTQGLVGVAFNNSIAAVVELSCETDFVARGDNFKALLEELTTSVLQHANNNFGNNTSANIKISQHELASLTTPSGRPLQEVVAMAVGKLGENITVRKAETLSAPTGCSIHAASHPKEGTNKVEMGKFVSVIALKRVDKEGLFPTDRLAAQLCQHVIGMRSESLGSPPEEKKETEKRKTGEDSNDELNEFFKGNTTEIDEDETALLRQAFMLNPSQTVYDYVKGHEAVIIDFVRTELGEARNE